MGVALPGYHSARPDGAVNGGAQSAPFISTIVGPDRGCIDYSANARYRNVTICARVQVSSGENVVALVPLVTPVSTAQLTALEETSVKSAAAALGLPACFHMNSTAISRVQGASGEKVSPLAISFSAAHATAWV